MKTTNILRTIFLTAILQLVTGIGQHAVGQPGALDPTFDPGSGISGGQESISAIAIQSDGKILIGGIFTSFDGTDRNRIARLNSDGSLDASFDPGEGADAAVYGFAIQDDGKILTVGSFTSYDGTNRNRIARLNSDGSLDASFNIGSGAGHTILDIVQLDDGKILIGGWFASYDGGAGVNRIVRLNADGTLDSSFDPGGGPSVESGSCYVGGITLQGDGKILICGLFTSFDGEETNYITRLNADGPQDTSFDIGDGPNDRVSQMAIQDDGKILIVGRFTSYDGTEANYIARLNEDGSLDTTFDPGEGADDRIQSINIQDDGKILIVGSFTSYDGTEINRIARLNTDGSLDTSFDPGDGADEAIWEIEQQEDGKVLIGGLFDSYDGTPINVARILTDSPVSIEGIVAPDSVTLWPNPVNDLLHIESEHPIDGVTMYDLSGKRVLSSSPLWGDRGGLIDLSELTSGVYVIKISSGGQEGTYRVVKR